MQRHLTDPSKLYQLLNFISTRESEAYARLKELSPVGFQKIKVLFLSRITRFRHSEKRSTETHSVTASQCHSVFLNQIWRESICHVNLGELSQLLQYPRIRLEVRGSCTGIEFPRLHEFYFCILLTSGLQRLETVFTNLDTFLHNAIAEINDLR